MTTTLTVYGTGCAKCRQLAEVTEQAARRAGIDYRLEKVTDLGAIAAAGVLRTPALAVDGALKVSGRVPTVDEVLAWLR